MIVRKLIVTLFALLILAGCKQNNGDFEVSISTADKFGVNETSFTQADPITITLTIKNISPDTKTLNFSNSQQYDLVIYNDADAEVWRWSNGMVFTAAITSFSLASGESQTFTYTWDQKTSTNGTLIPIGNYILEGHIVGISASAQRPLNII